MDAPNTTDGPILIVSDNLGDATLVKKLLGDDFGVVITSADPGRVLEDFDRHQPAVLILAFNAIEKAERYYLGIYRLSATLNLQPHRRTSRARHWQGPRWIVQAYLAGGGYAREYRGSGARDHPSQRRRHPPGLRDSNGFRAAAATMGGRIPAGSEPHLASVRSLDSLAQSVRSTVLVVDDDEFQRKLVAKILEDEDYHIDFAASGVEALNVLRKTRPDLILMDITMSDLDGMEVTRKVKAMPQFFNIPIIMVTGRREKNTVTASLNAGATDFIAKPFVRETLISKVAGGLCANKSAPE